MDICNSSLLVDVDLRHALVAVSKALDYVGIDDISHGHRVAYIAYECAKQLGWNEEKSETAFFAGLIHDCGVSQNQEHVRLLSQLQPQGAENHCVMGFEALSCCEPLEYFALPIRYHHTPWQELRLLDLPLADKELAAIIFLADRVDFLRASYKSDCHEDIVTLYEELIADSIMKHSGSLFHPEMALAMSQLVLKDGFWFAMESDYIKDIGCNFTANDWYIQKLSIEQLTDIAHFLANIVDAKSAFTFNHSLRVAQISVYLAGHVSLGEDTKELIYIAGLLHDVGKLKTPDEILHKTGALTKEEYSRIKRHTTDTQFTLKKFFPNSPIAHWACNHHEKLDGSGYPNRISAINLDTPSRIVAIADIFQALSQDRPYRGRLSKKEVVEQLAPLANSGKIDRAIFGVVMTNLDEVYAIATGEPVAMAHIVNFESF